MRLNLAELCTKSITKCWIEGMIKLKALVAISRKLLGLIFAIVRDNTLYIENYRI